MDAKEAIEELERIIYNNYVTSNAAIYAAISALEKVPVLEAENARLRKAICEKCKEGATNMCFSTKGYECEFWSSDKE